MKIGLITTFQFTCPANGWGAEEYMWSLCECLSEMSHEVILFATVGSKTPKNGKLIICESEKDVLDNHINDLKNCDIVHDFSSTKTIHDYCQQNGIKSICVNFNVHYLFPKNHKNICCVSDIQRYLGRSGRSGFEGTPWEQLVGFTGFLRSEGKRVYLGVDTEKYKPSNKPKDDYILYFNSFDYYKGITIVLDLAKEMGFKLVLAGEVSKAHQQTFNELKPIMDSLPNVKYEIDVSNERKIELMQNAKALLFPSMFQQPFAVVVIEALSCGTPVITTNMGAMPELIIHGKTGYLCNNIIELAKGINSINNIDNNNCRISVLKNFTREKMTIEYLKLYEDILKGESW